MPEVSNVLAGRPLATGGVLIGPLGTAAPTDATTELDAGFLAAGYIGEDGLTEGTERSIEKVKAWGGDTVKVLQTDYSVTYSFTFLESLNAEVLKAVYGDDNVTTTPADTTNGTLHTVKLNSDVLEHKSFVFEVKDGDARIRIHVPDGQVIETGEVTYNDSEVIGYQVTVEAYRDAVLGSNSVKYLDDGKPSAA